MAQPGTYTSTVLATDARVYVGVSSDAKPREDAEAPGGLVPSGSRFIERDTKREYEWNGSLWTLRAGDLATTQLVTLLEENNRLLKNILLGMTAVLPIDLANVEV